MDRKLKELKSVIQNRALIWGSSEPLIDNRGKSIRFLFDFRPLLQDPEFLSSITDIFWKRYGHYKKIQIATLELGCVTLLGALLVKAKELKIEANGLIVRKSRKKTGRQRIIEGEKTPFPTVVIDDILNSGGSFLKVQKVLQDADVKIKECFTILNFENQEAKTVLAKNGLKVSSLFQLKEFDITIDPKADPTNLGQFQDVFSYAPTSAPIRRHDIFPQSDPVLDSSGELIFYGTSLGDLICLNAKTGKQMWRYSTETVDPKGIAATPVYHQGVVYGAAYNGKVFALNAKNGRILWERRYADWIGSSPALSLKEKSIFVGMEHATQKHKGGLISLDIKTGDLKWQISSDEFIHGSPVYSMKNNSVAVGTNDGHLLMVDARTGQLRWKFKTLGAMKSSPVFFEDDKFIAIASHDAGVYCMRAKDGKLQQFFKTEGINYSKPLYYKRQLFAVSDDGNLYRLDLKTRKVFPELTTSGRIFSSPHLIKGKIFFGNNNGQIFEYDPQTRRLSGEHIVADRVLSSVVFNQKKNLYYFHSSDDRLFAFAKRKNAKAESISIPAKKGSTRGFESLISQGFRRSVKSVTRINKDGSLTIFNAQDRNHELLLEGLAVDIWTLLEESRSLKEIATIVALWRKITHSQAQRCLKPILKQLYSEGLLESIRS